MWQQSTCHLFIADKIIVDEIDRIPDPSGEHRVELGNDLLRFFEPRLATIEGRYVAKFAAVSVQFSSPQKIPPAFNQSIGWLWKVAQWQALGGRKPLLRRAGLWS
jgi:hypothetical protein